MQLDRRSEAVFTFDTFRMWQRACCLSPGLLTNVCLAQAFEYHSAWMSLAPDPVFQWPSIALASVRAYNVQKLTTNSVLQL